MTCCHLCGNPPHTGHLCDRCTLAIERDRRAVTGAGPTREGELAAKRIWTRERTRSGGERGRREERLKDAALREYLATHEPMAAGATA